MISEYYEWFQEDQLLTDLEAQVHQSRIDYWLKRHKKLICSKINKYQIVISVRKRVINGENVF
jgi:hypothetical protein